MTSSQPWREPHRPHSQRYVDWMVGVAVVGLTFGLLLLLIAFMFIVAASAQEWLGGLVYAQLAVLFLALGVLLIVVAIIAGAAALAANRRLPPKPPPDASRPPSSKPEPLAPSSGSLMDTRVLVVLVAVLGPAVWVIVRAVWRAGS